MNETEALQRMVPPSARRPSKYREGVIQIWITRACDKACFACTQGSNLGGKPGMITLDQFEQAVASLADYWGVVGIFGGNPAMHPKFEAICQILQKYIPKEQRGLWCNNPLGKGAMMRETFNPAVSNLNVHLDTNAFREFKITWPESQPFGADRDCRHSPPFVAMKDVLRVACPDCWDKSWVNQYEAVGGVKPDCPKCHGTGRVYDEAKAWELISNCDINQHWSAMIGVFRGEVRAWFCEIAGAQAMLHQDEPNYPDTGLQLTYPDGSPCWFDTDIGPYSTPRGGRHNAGRAISWWQLPMTAFTRQVRKHCHDCGVPLRGYGELSQSATGTEQVSDTHANIYASKVKGRPVQIVSTVDELRQGILRKVTDYMGNAAR